MTDALSKNTKKFTLRQKHRHLEHHPSPGHEVRQQYRPTLLFVMQAVVLYIVFMYSRLELTQRWVS